MSRRILPFVLAITTLLAGHVFLSPRNVGAQQPAPFFYSFESGSLAAAMVASARKESPNFAAAATFLESMGYQLVPETATTGVWRPQRERPPSTLITVSFNAPPSLQNSFATIFAVDNGEKQTATRIGVFTTEGDRNVSVRSGYIAHSGKVREAGQGIRDYLDAFATCGTICGAVALIAKHPAAIIGCLVVACGVAVIGELYSALEPKQCLIVGRDVIVRREPTEKGAVVAKLSNPTRVGCFEPEGDWVPVVFATNQDGYIHVKYVQFLTPRTA